MVLDSTLHWVFIQRERETEPYECLFWQCIIHFKIQEQILLATRVFVLEGIELIFFLVAGPVLCFGFSVLSCWLGLNHDNMKKLRRGGHDVQRCWRLGYSIWSSGNACWWSVGLLACSLARCGSWAAVWEQKRCVEPSEHKNLVWEAGRVSGHRHGLFC